MKCSEKARLGWEFDSAAQAYADAVKLLTANIGTTPKERYAEMAQAATEARSKCETARLFLEDHCIKHKC
jgi:hypothetical protein